MYVYKFRSSVNVLISLTTEFHQCEEPVYGEAEEAQRRRERSRCAIYSRRRSVHEIVKMLHADMFQIPSYKQRSHVCVNHPDS